MPFMPAMAAEAGGSLWFQGQPSLHSEFQASQGYKVRPCLQISSLKQKYERGFFPPTKGHLKAGCAERWAEQLIKIGEVLELASQKPILCAFAYTDASQGSVWDVKASMDIILSGLHLTITSQTCTVTHPHIHILATWLNQIAFPVQTGW